jgi:RimJ/RimL family protein N-acetyltransferase
MAAVLADPELHRFMGDAPLDAAALRSRYERLVAGPPDPDVAWLNWVIQVRDGAHLAGTLQATVSLGGTRPVAEIAWVVGTPWQGQGFATEAAVGLVGWLADQGVGTVIAHIHPDHDVSAAVARAAGLAPTRRLEHGELRWRLELGISRRAP